MLITSYEGQIIVEILFEESFHPIQMLKHHEVQTLPLKQIIAKAHPFIPHSGIFYSIPLPKGWISQNLSNLLSSAAWELWAPVSPSNNSIIPLNTFLLIPTLELAFHYYSTNGISQYHLVSDPKWILAAKHSLPDEGFFAESEANTHFPSILIVKADNPDERMLIFSLVNQIKVEEGAKTLSIPLDQKGYLLPRSVEEHLLALYFYLDHFDKLHHTNVFLNDDLMKCAFQELTLAWSLLPPSPLSLHLISCIFESPHMRDHADLATIGLKLFAMLLKQKLELNLTDPYFNSLCKNSTSTIKELFAFIYDRGTSAILPRS